MRKRSENRFVKRFLLRRGERKYEHTVYSDNIGVEYDYKWVAALSSFCNVFMGCLKNGFPVVVPWLWYPAWAFYPFFLIRGNLNAGVNDVIAILGHERIHVRQQRDLHIMFSLPLIGIALFGEVLGWFNPLYLLIVVPFVPTIFYGIDMLRAWFYLWDRNTTREVIEELDSSITFAKVRAYTCFEREATSHCLNEEYLKKRKFMAVLKYI